MRKHISLLLALCAAPAAWGVPPDFPSRKEIHALMLKVNDWQKAHPVMGPNDRNWERATWYTGVVAAWKATGDRRLFDQAEAWGRQHAWQVGTESDGANRLFCSQTWLEVYFAKKDRAMIEPTVRWLDTKAPNSPAGATRWYLENARSYVDSLYGASSLAMLAKATGDARYIATMHAFFDDVTGELFDKESGLYYRDNRYIGKRTARGRKIFWSRGNGWVMAGIVRVLANLPQDDPLRPHYIALLREMAAEVASLQGSDGLWRPGLLDASNYPLPEVSGSAFFTYAIAWGINHRMLDSDKYLPVVMRAWAGMLTHVYADGRLGCIQPIGEAPADYKPSSSYNFGVGAFLLAGAEMEALSGRKHW